MKSHRFVISVDVSGNFVQFEVFALQIEKFNEEKGEELKKIWPNIETVQIRNCSIDDDLHDIFLIHCKNIMRLFVQSESYELWS